MRKERRVWLAPVVALAATFALVAPASAVVVRGPNGHFLGIAPRHGIAPASIRGSVAAAHLHAQAAATGQLSYNGGPVLHSSAPYLIFWTPSGESMPAGSESLMQRYFTDVAAAGGSSANVYGVARQFTDGGGFADYRQTFAPSSQVIVDTQTYPVRDPGNCPDVAPTYPKCITDAQLQAELARLIGVRGLPSGTGPNAPIYFIVTPADVNVCIDASNCADTAFCAYHSFFGGGRPSSTPRSRSSSTAPCEAGSEVVPGRRQHRRAGAQRRSRGRGDRVHEPRGQRGDHRSCRRHRVV